MRLELDEQGVVVGINPIEISEISSTIRKKLISLRPDLSYIEEQGPESLMPVLDNEPLAINTIIEIFSESVYNSQLLFASFLNSWGPATAEGFVLDHVGSTFFGLSRTRAEPSEANIILVGNRGKQAYTATTPEPIKVPKGFTVSVSGRSFLTKYEQEFTSSFDEASHTLTLTGIRYIKLRISEESGVKKNARFDTNNISHSSSETDVESVAQSLLKQVMKFAPWSALYNKSIVKDEIIGGIDTTTENGKALLGLGFDEPVNITIPNTLENKIEVVTYGIEFYCREAEDDVEGLITAGTEIAKIDPAENKKIVADNTNDGVAIECAYLWEDSTRVIQTETDDEYRERLKATTTITAVGSPESMKYSMLKIPNVTHCHIINNPTANKKSIQPPSDSTGDTEEDVDATNESTGVRKLPKFDIDPYSFCVFVEGGNSRAITQTIYNCTPVGIASSGNRYVPVKAANGETVIVRFARPVPKTISILVKFTKGKSGLEVTSYQPPTHVVEAMVRTQIMLKVGELQIGALLKVQELGRDLISIMPWMAHYIITVADKGGVTDKSSSDFKEVKQLESEPYEFFFVKREDIVVEEEQLG